MRYTANYNLNVPEDSDKPDINPIGENMDTIDTELAKKIEVGDLPIIANNLNETAVGKALDAVQGKIINDDLVAHKADNAKHVNKVAFACTPKTGYTIISDKSYLINKTVYIQLVIKKTDDTTFASGNQNIVVVPYSPEINLISLNANGLDEVGNPTIISQAVFYQYNKEILVTVIETTAKTIYIAGVYTIV